MTLAFHGTNGITVPGVINSGNETIAGSLAVSGGAYVPETTLTDAATISWAANTQQVAKVTLAGNRTMAAPTGLVAGTVYSLMVIQDATGSRTLAWNSVFRFINNIAPTLSTAPGAIDIIGFRTDGTYMREIGRAQGES